MSGPTEKVSDTHRGGENTTGPCSAASSTRRVRGRSQRSQTGPQRAARETGAVACPGGTTAAPAACAQDGRFIWQEVGCAPTEASICDSVFQP